MAKGNKQRTDIKSHCLASNIAFRIIKYVQIDEKRLRLPSPAKPARQHQYVRIFSMANAFSL